MMEPSAEYQAAVADAQDAVGRAVRAFAAYFAAEWQMSRDEWLKAYADPLPKGDWFDGYNAGVESALAAADSFLGDFHP